MLANYTFKGGIPKKLGDTETYGTLSKETTSSPQYQFYWKNFNYYYWRF